MTGTHTTCGKGATGTHPARWHAYSRGRRLLRHPRTRPVAVGEVSLRTCKVWTKASAPKRVKPHRSDLQIAALGFGTQAAARSRQLPLPARHRTAFGQRQAVRCENIGSWQAALQLSKEHGRTRHHPALIARFPRSIH